MEVEPAALVNYIHVLSVGVLTHTFIYLMETYTSPLCVLCYTIYLTLAVVVQSSSFTVNTCSVECPGGVPAMNNDILVKWRIALSINIGVLENH